MRGAGVEKLAKAVWNLHRVSADIRLYSSVMGKPSWVPMSKCSCYVLYLPHVYTGRGRGYIHGGCMGPREHTGVAQRLGDYLVLLYVELNPA